MLGKGNDVRKVKNLYFLLTYYKNSKVVEGIECRIDSIPFESFRDEFFFCFLVVVSYVCRLTFYVQGGS